MTKIVLMTIPRISPSPQVGTAVVLAHLLSENIDAEIFDANLDAHDRFYENPLWDRLEAWGIQQTDRGLTAPEIWAIIDELLTSWVVRLKELNATHVGISVFTQESRNWAKWLCYYIRRDFPEAKIILGGKGINQPGIAAADFGEYCLQWQLCDYYLNGESEKELVEFLKGSPSVINNYDTFILNDNLDTSKFLFIDGSEYTYLSKWYDTPLKWYEADNPEEVKNTLHNKHTTFKHADYNDFTHKMSFDHSTTHKTFATRGCVKQCTFCDVPLLRPKFSMRSPQNLADEFKFVIEEHGVTNVTFLDDMINGSNSQFIKWMELVAKYFEECPPPENFRWFSQFGLKNRRGTPKEMFDLLARTRAALSIGVEHFSDPVLAHMKKLYNKDDIYWFFEEGTKYSYNYKNLMFIVAYPTETLEDFAQLKQGIIDISEITGKQVMTWDLNMCGTTIGSPIANLEGMHTGNNQVNWQYDKNPTLTSEEKARRIMELEDVMVSRKLSQPRHLAASLRIKSWLK